MLLLIAAAAASPPRPTVRVQATARVRIERPVAASSEEWKRIPEGHRREIVIRDESGRPLLLRLIENE